MALSFISLYLGKTETSRQKVVPTQYPRKTSILNSIDECNDSSSFDFGQHLASFPKRLLCLTPTNEARKIRWFVYFLMLVDPLILTFKFYWLDVEPPDLSPLVSTRSLSKLSTVMFSSISGFLFFLTKWVSTDFTEINEKCTALSLNKDEYFMNNFAPKKNFHQNVLLFVRFGITIFYTIYITLILRINHSLTWFDVFIILDGLMMWYRMMVMRNFTI